MEDQNRPPLASLNEAAAALGAGTLAEVNLRKVTGAAADEARGIIEPIEQFFAFAHLPPHLQAVSAPFCHLANAICEALPRNAERTVALRKLLESKDAAVRAALAK